MHADGRALLQERMIVEYDNARVLITDQKLETIKEVLPLLEQLTRINAPLLIIAEDVTGATIWLLGSFSFASICCKQMDMSRRSRNDMMFRSCLQEKLVTHYRSSERYMMQGLSASHILIYLFSTAGLEGCASCTLADSYGIRKCSFHAGTKLCVCDGVTACVLVRLAYWRGTGNFGDKQDRLKALGFMVTKAWVLTGAPGWQARRWRRWW